MPDWLYVVETQVEPAVEDEWNRWYDEVHVKEMLGCPGWLWGERYLREDDSGKSYITLYGMSGPEALESPEFEAARGWGKYADKLTYSARLHRRASAA